MSSFVSQLRTTLEPIVLSQGPGTITVRVEASDIWETVRVVASPETAVAELKQRVVAELFPERQHRDFVLKLRGWEMLNDRETLAAAGVGEGSIVLLAYRRRRPVR
jgi:hypothetical protein